MTPHEIAVEAIKRYLAKGTIREITAKPDVCFAEFESTLKLASECIGLDDMGYYDNTIIHLLDKHGVGPKEVGIILTNALQRSNRIIVLTGFEHAPNTKIDIFAYQENLECRNMLTVYNRLRFVCFSPSIGAHYDKPHPGFKVAEYGKILHTSEWRRGRQLLETNDAIFASIHQGDHWLVCGAFMFLEYIAQCAPAAVHVVDRCNQQILAAATVTEGLIHCDTIADFDKYILSAFGEITPKEHEEWIYLLTEGDWRMKYKEVRRCCIYLHYGELEIMPIRNGSIVYTSTLPASQWPKFNGHIIEALTKRNHPKLRSIMNAGT